jgi:hypothetical protein
MHRSRLLSGFAVAFLIGGLSVAGCSQKTRSQDSTTGIQDADKNGQYVVVDGERVFVPGFYLDSHSPLRAPDKVARDILRGRKIIKSGKATTTFVTSRKGTEMTVDMIEFEPGEPQTRPEQITYILERVKVFNGMLRESDMPVNDTVSGAGTGLLIALKILGRNDALAEAKRRQQTFQERIFIDEAYQGRTDAEKQSTYEWVAFFAVEALNELKKSKAARTAAEREAAQKKSRDYAELVNSFISTGQLTPAP